LAEFGARWLGWDVARGVAATQPDLPGLDAVTMAPRKYGFHGTLKPPFRLAKGRNLAELEHAVASLAAATPPATCDRLQLAVLGRFLALTPHGDITGIAHLAGACVTKLDMFRAPASEAELARRRTAGLSPAQDALLVKWGYPYVLDEFRFHLTLTAALPENEIARWTALAETHLPPLAAPFVMDDIALAGERPDGAFELIHRYALSG